MAEVIASTIAPVLISSLVFFFVARHLGNWSFLWWFAAFAVAGFVLVMISERADNIGPALVLVFGYLPSLVVSFIALWLGLVFPKARKGGS